MRPSLAAVPFVLSTLVACAAPTASSEEDATASTASAVQAKVDAFTRAVLDHDVTGLEQVVSREVVAQGQQRGVAFPRFLEKQRNALVNTLRLEEGQRPVIVVAKVTEEGDAVVATLRVGDEELKKPFYLVREDGELKVNIAPPGFSKTAPDGAAFSKSNYTVRNDMIRGNPNLVLGCYQGKLSNGQHKPYAQVSVPPLSSKKVACEDACGWWAGTFFTDGNSTKHCDWNAFGADVIQGVYGGGWTCADFC